MTPSETVVEFVEAIDHLQKVTALLNELIDLRDKANRRVSTARAAIKRDVASDEYDKHFVVGSTLVIVKARGEVVLSSYEVVESSTPIGTAISDAVVSEMSVRALALNGI